MVSNLQPDLETYAAVDLGSNSFHLLVTRVRKTALGIYDCLTLGQPAVGAQRRLLGWAADLHETGLQLEITCLQHE